jgi:tetratricopeptide (TPR) repeat protein
VLAEEQASERFWAFPDALTVLGLVCYGQGRWEDARRYFEDNMVAITRNGRLAPIHFAPSMLAECELRAGHPERARARLAPLLERAEREEGDVSLLLPPYAWAHLDLGEVAAAAALIERAVATATAKNDRLALVDALRVQALVASRQGHSVEAMQALEEGIALARGMPYPYAEARLLHVYGQMSVHTRQLELARERLEAALAIFQRLGARKDIKQIEQTMAAL